MNFNWLKLKIYIFFFAVTKIIEINSFFLKKDFMNYFFTQLFFLLR